MAMIRRLLFYYMLAVGTTIFLFERQLHLASVTTAQTQREASVIDYFNSPPKGDESRPLLSDLIGEQGDEIKQVVQFLMDFAIICHPKTATSTTLEWFSTHKEIKVYTQELHALKLGNLTEHVRLMYNLPAGRDYKRGYKAPKDIQVPQVLRALATYWPKTKLICGLRHPVTWFQSFYNFRVRTGVSMPPAETLLGRCRPNMKGVCTDEALFHVHLSNLGKTNKTSPEEMKLLAAPPYKTLNLPRLPNPVFLYEISQLHDPNQTRASQYRTDLQLFLGLNEPFEPISEAEPLANKTHEINICHNKYVKIRRVLMKHARAASTWIREYFLPHPDVHVSSKEHFEQLVKNWMVDPCIGK